MQQGIQKGIEQGIQKGMKQGMQQGMLAEAREMVLEALGERFGVIPADLEKRILAMDSRRQLKELLRQALRVQSLDEFQSMLI
jgi:flagellar biosynthesis/type III secretory pathway protein FliH